MWVFGRKCTIHASSMDIAKRGVKQWNFEYLQKRGCWWRWSHRSQLLFWPQKFWPRELFFFGWCQVKTWLLRVGDYITQLCRNYSICHGIRIVFLSNGRMTHGMSAVTWHSRGLDRPSEGEFLAARLVGPNKAGEWYVMKNIASLKLTAEAPENRPQHKRKVVSSLPTIHLQVQTVGFREGMQSFLLTNFCFVDCVDGSGELAQNWG